ncbi:MAG: N-acetylmuramoyl-L-alanine amidase [Firmicutes bacterium]|jgi:N-acetylmuramoyl-L-alanine amidase|nr:N-acetylmuramoyl-L-alanine amidase [Bacillota bacterium]
MGKKRGTILLVIPKHYFVAVALLLLCLIGFSIYRSYPLAMVALSVRSIEIEYDVMLDAGHGGIDSGAVGRDDVYEKDIALDIVLRMKEILEKAGLTVGLTRDIDTDLSHLSSKGTRHEKDKLARFQLMHKGRIGMSVHVNASKDPSVNGAIIFYMRDSYIGERYAQNVFDELERVQNMNHNYVVPRSNLILLKVSRPTILVETGFISNSSDYEKLIDPEFRQSVAEALAKGIIMFHSTHYLEQTE